MSSDLLPKLQKLCENTEAWGVSAQQVADRLKLHRSNVSRQLSRLAESGLVERKEGRPVLFRNATHESLSLEKLIGADGSLQEVVRKTKAALLYPPHGLHTLLFGATGVGKSLLARLMHHYALHNASFTGPFIDFNCADYAHNPQLLLSQLFGTLKGSFTGATHDRIGHLEQADGGILFLDEIHRLPAEGQEMLFMYLDTGYFRSLGETKGRRKAQVFLAAATTEAPDSVLLNTFRRRIPMEIQIPLLSERPWHERLAFIRLFFKEEKKRLSRKVWVEPLALQALLVYDCTGNVGQLKRDIQLACAQAYVDQQDRETINILLSHLPPEAKRGTLQIQHKEDHPFLNLLLEEEFSELKKDKGEDFSSHTLQLPSTGMNVTNTITKMVGNKIASLVEELLNEAENRLNVLYPEKVHTALAMHIYGMSKKMADSKYEEPQLNELRKNHPGAFVYALESIPLLEKVVEREITINEAGYLTLFFSYNEMEEELEEKKAAVIVISHGESTASSMLNVAQQLLGTQDGWAIDMPLNLQPEHVYLNLKKLCSTIDISEGVLILADMGSALHFGELLSEETGIDTETVPNVSTLFVIDALRKANLGQDIKAIVNSIEQEKPLPLQRKVKETNHRYVVVFNCTTGKGGAKQLEQVVLQEIIFPEGVTFRSISLNDWSVYSEELMENKQRITAVVGLWQPPKPVPIYLSPSECFHKEGKEELQSILDLYGKRWALLNKMKPVIREQLGSTDTDHVIQRFLDWVEDAEANAQEMISEGSFAGILLHFCCLVDRVINEKLMESKQPVTLEFSSSLVRSLHDTVPLLESSLNLTLPEYEKSVLLSLFQERKEE